MPIRPALPSDTPSMASTAAAAFIQDSLLASLLHPHRHTYPTDWARSWERRFRASMCDSSKAVLVATDEATGRVVGVAEWERWSAAGQQKRILRAGVGGAWGLRSKAEAVRARLSALVWPDRSADAAQAGVLAETFPLIAHVWGGERAETWFLDLLCVVPEGQGRGFGCGLVEWGVGRAEEEGVCASLICADGKEPFYARRGFTVEGGRANVGALSGASGGAILFTEVGKGRGGVGGGPEL